MLLIFYFYDPDAFFDLVEEVFLPPLPPPPPTDYIKIAGFFLIKGLKAGLKWLLDVLSEIPPIQ